MGLSLLALVKSSSLTERRSSSSFSISSTVAMALGYPASPPLGFPLLGLPYEAIHQCSCCKVMDGQPGSYLYSQGGYQIIHLGNIILGHTSFL